MNTRIPKFVGRNAFLSNFHPSPIGWDDPVLRMRVGAPTVEHAFQCAKTLDRTERMRVLAATSPGHAKRIGRVVTLRDDWEQIKLPTMRYFLARKFALGSDLAQQLLDTGGADLIEGNHWNDTFWGVCNGQGANHLGALLMERRTQLNMLLNTNKVVR